MSSASNTEEKADNHIILVKIGNMTDFTAPELPACAFRSARVHTNQSHICTVVHLVGLNGIFPREPIAPMIN